MAEIPHHLRCMKPYINNGINYLSTGAGFQPSTVVPVVLYDIFGLRDSELEFPLSTGRRSCQNLILAQQTIHSSFGMLLNLFAVALFFWGGGQPRFFSWMWWIFQPAMAQLCVPSGKLTWLAGKWTRIFQMYLQLNMGKFQPAMSVYKTVVYWRRCSWWTTSTQKTLVGFEKNI